MYIHCLCSIVIFEQYKIKFFHKYYFGPKILPGVFTQMSSHPPFWPLLHSLTSMQFVPDPALKFWSFKNLVLFTRTFRYDMNCPFSYQNLLAYILHRKHIDMHPSYFHKLHWNKHHLSVHIHQYPEIRIMKTFQANKMKLPKFFVPCCHTLPYNAFHLQLAPNQVGIRKEMILI